MSHVLFNTIVRVLDISETIALLFISFKPPFPVNPELLGYREGSLPFWKIKGLKNNTNYYFVTLSGILENCMDTQVLFFFFYCVNFFSIQ